MKCCDCKAALPATRKLRYCSPCAKTRNAANRDKRQAAEKVKYDSDPQYREKRRAKCRKYQTDRPLELRRTKWNEWRANNRLMDVARQQRRRARELGAEGSFTKEDIKRIFDAQGGKCIECGEVKSLTVDHWYPLSKGGSNDPENLQGLCKSCNSRKGSKCPFEWRPAAFRIRFYCREEVA